MSNDILPSKELTWAERVDAAKSFNDVLAVAREMSYEVERLAADNKRLAKEAHEWWSALAEALKSKPTASAHEPAREYPSPAEAFEKLAAALPEGFDFPAMDTSDASPVTQQEIVSAIFHHARELTRLTETWPAQPPPVEWQPIDTAPKDGTPVLVSNAERGGAWIAYYLPVYPSGYKPDNPWSSLMLNMRWHGTKWASTEPTHWQPIPAPYSTATKGVTHD